MSFLKSVAKVAGIVAAPFTYGQSLKLTEAAYADDAAKKAAAAQKTNLTTVQTEAQAAVEVAKINAEQADKVREQEKFLAEQNIKAMLELKESNQDATGTGIISTQPRNQGVGNLAIAGTLAYYLLRGK